jgi:hypothetical protein
MGMSESERREGEGEWGREEEGREGREGERKRGGRKRERGRGGIQIETNNSNKENKIKFHKNHTKNFLF